MPTPLHIYAAAKAAKREADRLAKLQQPQATAAVPQAVAPAAALIVPPSTAAVDRIQVMLDAAQADLVAADAELADASYEALIATDEREADTRLTEARQVRDKARERVAAATGALSIARQKQADAAAQEQAAAVAEQVATVRALLVERDDATALLAAHLAGAIARFHEVLEINAKAISAWPGRAPQGALLEPMAFVAKVQHELHRISAGKPRLPSFPGSTSPTINLVNAPDLVPPLVDEVARCGEYLLRTLLDAVPAAAPAVAPVAKPAASAPIASVVPSAPTRTAAEIRAAIPTMDLAQYLAAPAVHHEPQPHVGD